MKTPLKFVLSAILVSALAACNANNISTSVPTIAVPTTTISVEATAGAPNKPPVLTQPGVTVEPPTPLAPTQTAIITNGADISFSGTSFTIPASLASGAQSDIVPQSNDPNVPFLVNPAYTRFQLQGYPLQGKAFEPQILIFPAKEFAQLSEGAAMITTNLQSMLATQQILPAEPLPFLPMYNAGQVFHAQEKFLSFKNGTGIRFITQFDQAPLPINNTELLYTFQGLTSDGEYYVSVTMPVNLPYLPADNNTNTITPADGVPFEWDMSKFSDYLTTITNRLNQADNTFTPTLDTLDGLVGSLFVVGQK